MLEGAVQVRSTSSLPGLPTTEVGAPGFVIGVTEAEAVEYGPCPAWFLAAILNTYGVPLVRLVTVVDSVEDTPSANVTHVVPLFKED